MTAKSTLEMLPEDSALDAAIIASIRSGESLLGSEGVLTPLIKRALEAAAEGELDAHLASGEGNGIANRRNGKCSKMMRSEHGWFELSASRDRNGSFEPEIVKKRQTIPGESLEQRIPALFGVGMSYEDISAHLKRTYDFDASPATISAVTDRLLPVIADWRSRPLDAVYPIVFMDGMYIKARQDGKVVTKVLYNIPGIDQHGRKDILGFYIHESEGAKFRLGVLNDLRERGVKDILIACVDGLKGFPEAIGALFPGTERELCVIHQIRNSLKYIAGKDQKEFMKDLKLIYKASSKETAEYHLLEPAEKYGEKYPAVIASRQNNREHLSACFKYSSEIRRVIYTANAIEGFHRQIRKTTKTKGAFTSENALFKLVFCAINNIRKNWTQPIQNWALTASQLHIHFGNRMLFDMA